MNPEPQTPAEQDLDRSFRLLQSTLDAIPAYVAILDSAGKVTAVNSEWRTYARDHVLIGPSCGVGADYVKVCEKEAEGGDEGMGMLAAGLKQVLRGGPADHTQEYSVMSLGDRLWFQARITRFEGVEGVHVMVAQLNITQRRRMEEELKRSEERLRQAQKMEAVGQLAGGVAHDFNNILTAILGYAEILQARIEEGSPLRRYVDQIRSGGERAAGLTHQLLAFSRRQMLEMKVVDLNGVVRDISGMLHRILGEDVKQVQALAPDLGKVRVDPGQMGQIVMNLAVNARDAMPEGGKLIIETANMELDETYAAGHPEVVPGPYVMLAVSDTGKGMDAATLAHIFEPFFTTKDPGKGTGLGLATVFGIVKQSGGHVWVYSEPGKGTSFKIHLPRVDSPAPGAAGSKPRLPRGNEAILVAEDEETIRSLVTAVLEGCGYTVIAASSGEEAMAAGLKEKRTIDLLLTDVVMPGISGVDLAAKLAASRPGLKVLFMSGYTDNVVLHHGVSTSTMAFLQKPFTQAVLASRVRGVLDGEAGKPGI